MPDTLQRPLLRRGSLPPPINRTPSGNGRGDDGGHDDAPHGMTQPAFGAQFGMWLLLGSLTILFAAFSSAYIVRVGPLTERVSLPPILWFNTLLLALSSLLLQQALGRSRRGDRAGMHRLLGFASLLGLLFLFGQLAAWRTLAAEGVFLQTHPASSFFYVLTAAHGLHVLGGLIALGWAFLQSARSSESTALRLQAVLQNTALYWHFLGLIWIWIFLLLAWF
jgi:cytochrome c oxidase subunit 3